MKYLAVASGAYSDYSINIFLRVPDDFNLSDKVREFAAKTGMVWVEKKKTFYWPDGNQVATVPVENQFNQEAMERRQADRRRRMREAGCVFDDAMFKWTIEEKDAFFLWLKQQPGVEVVDYTEQCVASYGGLKP